MSRSMKRYTHEIFPFPEPIHFICAHDEIVLEGHVDDECWELDLFNMEELDQDIQAARDDVKDSDGEKKAKAEAVLAQLEDSKAAVEAVQN